jgi:hypothetical protein
MLDIKQLERLRTYCVVRMPLIMDAYTPHSHSFLYILMPVCSTYHMDGMVGANSTISFPPCLDDSICMQFVTAVDSMHMTSSTHI